MGAPDMQAQAIAPPQFLKREQPARFGWWSDRSLVIVKGGETLTLDADDLRGLIRFFGEFDVEGRV